MSTHRRSSSSRQYEYPADPEPQFQARQNVQLLQQQYAAAQRDHHAERQRNIRRSRDRRYDGGARSTSHQSNRPRKHRVNQPFDHDPALTSRRNGVKNHLIAATGEFVGTFIFLFFGFAIHLMVIEQDSEVAIIRNGGSPAQTIVFISLGYGFSFLVTAWGWYRISGGLFNPAVTLSLCLAGQLSWIRALFLMPSQITGAISAAAMCSVLFPAPIQIANTTLGPHTTAIQGLFIEMFLTALLIFIVLMLAIEKSKDTFIAPVGIGLALFVSELAGVFYTGGSLNPARSLGPAVAGIKSTPFESYHWIYWVGPILGGILSALYYRAIKFLNYEEANPGQDDDGEKV